MSTMDSLPPEILHVIGENLTQKDLYALIRMSRGMHNGFKKRLYTNVTLSSSEYCQASILFHTVARDPKLASYVQTLTVCSWKTQSVRWPPRKEFDESLIHKLVTERADYSLYEKPKWLEDIKKFSDDAWLALLIPRLKKLRKISFTWAQKAHHVLGMFASAVLQDGASFSHLEEVYINWEDSKVRPISTAGCLIALPFFIFPSMRKIGSCRLEEKYVEGACNASECLMLDILVFGMREIPRRSSNITDLDFSNIYTEYNFNGLIRACEALKTFRLHYDESPFRGHVPEPSEIYESLLSQKSTLEALWMATYQVSSFGRIPLDWMGPFNEFTALKLLKIRLINLVAASESDRDHMRHVLPKSLQSLYLDIEWDMAILSDVMTELREVAISRELPNLDTLSFEFTSAMEEERVASFESLQKACEENEINCEWHVKPEKKDDEKERWKDIWPFPEAKSFRHT